MIYSTAKEFPPTERFIYPRVCGPSDSISTCNNVASNMVALGPRGHIFCLNFVSNI